MNELLDLVTDLRATLVDLNDIFERDFGARSTEINLQIARIDSALARIAARQGEDVQQASREAQEPDQAPENTTQSPKGKQ